MKIQRNISFWISLKSKLININLIKTLIKILFSSNFGMQISAKIWDYLKKIINPFENLNFPLKIQRNANIGKILGFQIFESK